MIAEDTVHAYLKYWLSIILLYIDLNHTLRLYLLTLIHCHSIKTNRKKFGGNFILLYGVKVRNDRQTEDLHVFNVSLYAYSIITSYVTLWRLALKRVARVSPTPSQKEIAGRLDRNDVEVIDENTFDIFDGIQIRRSSRPRD